MVRGVDTGEKVKAESVLAVELTKSRQRAGEGGEVVREGKGCMCSGLVIGRESGDRWKEGDEHECEECEERVRRGVRGGEEKGWLTGCKTASV